MCVCVHVCVIVLHVRMEKAKTVGKLICWCVLLRSTLQQNLFCGTVWLGCRIWLSVRFVHEEWDEWKISRIFGDIQQIKRLTSYEPPKHNEEDPINSLIIVFFCFLVSIKTNLNFGKGWVAKKAQTRRTGKKKAWIGRWGQIVLIVYADETWEQVKNILYILNRLM